MQKKQKKKQIDVKSTLILHRRTFIFYLICCQCFKSTKGNSLLSTKAYGIFVQSTIKGISLSSCDIVSYRPEFTTKPSLA